MTPYTKHLPTLLTTLIPLKIIKSCEAPVHGIPMLGEIVFSFIYQNLHDLPANKTAMNNFQYLFPLRSPCYPVHEPLPLLSLPLQRVQEPQ
jgi:hypothetical protein